MLFSVSREVIEAVLASAVIIGSIYAFCAGREARQREDAFKRKFGIARTFGGGRIR